MYYIKDLHYSIDKKVILQDISFVIEPNKFLSVIGPNGSGKSTLVKIINKNIHRYEGKVVLHQKNIEQYSYKELASYRAVLNQSIDFPYHFKVAEIINFSLDIHDISIAQKKNIQKLVLEKLNLADIQDRDYQTLSGGQKQWVQLARVIAQIFIDEQEDENNTQDDMQNRKLNGRFLFLDEPTLNLDIFRQYTLLNLLKDLMQEYKIGVCAVLHDLHQAYLYSDNVLILDEGKIKFFGTTKKALTKKNISETFHVRSDIILSTALQQLALITSL